MKQKNRAELIQYEKHEFDNGALLEVRLWSFESNENYPEGFKYSLIYIDGSRERKVLMDNHSPKGHHYHLDSKQFEYNFVSFEILIHDFKDLVSSHMGVKL